MNTAIRDISIERIARGGTLHPNPLPPDPRRSEAGLARLLRIVAWQRFAKASRP